MDVEALRARADAKAADLAPIINRRPGKLAAGLNDIGLCAAGNGRHRRSCACWSALIPFAKKKRRKRRSGPTNC